MGHHTIRFHGTTTLVGPPRTSTVRVRKGGRAQTACDPNDLKKFYDRSYWDAIQKHNASPLRGHKMRRQTCYSPLSSWEGLSQNAGPFSRLADCFTVNKPTRQIGIVGPQVVEMDQTAAGGVFGNGVDDPVKTRPIPPTIEQVDVQHVVEEKPSHDKAVVVEDPRFVNMFVTVPEVKMVEVPEYVKRAGNNADQVLLHPIERRQIMLLERDRALADKKIRKAIADKHRLVSLMKARHPVGIVGVDSTANLESEVYGPVAKVNLAKEEATAARHQHRYDFLAYRKRHEQRLGFDILEHCESADGLQGVKAQALRKEVQLKRQTPGPVVNTHERIFGQRPGVVHPLRTQHLWDQSMGGKNYDIISHSVPEFWKPRFVHEETRGVVKAMTHPSQASLERGRNMQGTLPFSVRCSSPFLDPWV